MKEFFLGHFLEIPAVLSGLINIYLAARASLWNWLFGIITVSLYIVIFYHVKLYADMSLYFLFLGLQFYGYYQWKHGGERHKALMVRNIKLSTCIVSGVVSMLLFGVIAYLLYRYTDSTTVLMDALITALSLIAQWMLSNKYLENWWLWILIDAMAIKMYLVKNLYLTAGLYAVFLGLCLMGYFSWKKQLPQSQMAC